MPYAPARPCLHPGCPALTLNGRCEKHGKQQRKELDARRGTAASRGYNWRWQRSRDNYLLLHPLCVKCIKEDRIVEATVVDHIIPHKGDHKLFWNEANWQALCKSCHDAKTAKEGRWGDGKSS